MFDFRKMRHLINRLPMARYRVDLANARATRVTASLTGMPHGGGVTSQVESGVMDIVAARERYDAIREELAGMVRELRPMIEQLEDPLERNAMRLRYLEGHRVPAIADALSYSDRRIYQVLEKAEANISLIANTKA